MIGIWLSKGSLQFFLTNCTLTSQFCTKSQKESCLCMIFQERICELPFDTRIIIGKENHSFLIKICKKLKVYYVYYNQEQIMRFNMIQVYM